MEIKEKALQKREGMCAGADPSTLLYPKLSPMSSPHQTAEAHHNLLHTLASFTAQAARFEAGVHQQICHLGSF